MNEVADAVVPGVRLCPTLDKMCYHFERVDHSTMIIGWGAEIINGKNIKLIFHHPCGLRKLLEFQEPVPFHEVTEFINSVS